MTPDELSLLLFLETCAVDHGGLVDVHGMNDEDRIITNRWHEAGYIEYGRIRAHDIRNFANSSCTHWVELSPTAFRDAHQERIARAERMKKKRTWNKTRF